MINMKNKTKSAKVIQPKPILGYTRIPVWIFDDMDYYNLGERAKLLLPYLVGGPGSGRAKHLLPPGIFQRPFNRIASDHNWTRKELDKVLKELKDTGWILTDERNGLILMPAVVTHVDNPSHLIGTIRKLHLVPISPLRQMYFELIVTRTSEEEKAWKVHPVDQLKEFSDELPDGLDLSFLSRIRLIPEDSRTKDG